MVWKRLRSLLLSSEERELFQLIERAVEEEVTELDLSKKGLTKLLPEIAQLTTLSQLYLWRNQLSSLPPEIGKLTNLTSLHLQHNQLRTLPTEIGELSKLTILSLSDNNLHLLPPTIGQLTSLTSLGLLDNELTTLPPEIGQLRNLTELDLSNNQLSQLPPEIGHLENLTKLDLSNNELSALPAEIGQLRHLTTLDLSGNQLSALPAEIGQLTNLKTLRLSDNKMRALPSEIGQLKILTLLDLTNNEFTTVRELLKSLKRLKSLTTLNLSHNQFRTLDKKIGQVKSLTTLNLNNNKLNKIPSEIGRLSNLTTLSVSHNNLNMLPREIGQLKCLRHLDLRDNSDLPIPTEIVARIDQPATIIEHYLSVRKTPLNEVKLILVGQGNVGKTSLVKRLIENDFDQNEPKTNGINIKSWNVSINRERVKVNIWDLGGQEIMHATHQFFMSQRTLYLLVLDARQGVKSSRLPYWLNLIDSFGGNSPIIVVINKIDQDLLDLNQRELKEKYPNIKKFVSISCKTGQRIRELRKIIRTIIRNDLKHAHQPIAPEWFQIKKKLESDKRDYIQYKKSYLRRCTNQNIHTKQEQRDLIRLLHDLGSVLSFEDHARLKDMVVLNPEWMTGGVYEIINAKLIKQSGGVLHIEQLDQILDQERYPREKHGFLIDLMRKFEICFDIEGHIDEKFLIPDLLPVQQPQFEWPAESLNFEYHYDFLPSSVISRVMVRLHRFVFQETYWRTGVVLVNNKNKALIKAFSTSASPQISISISGEPQGGRAFWAIIREQFEHIHASIKNINPKAHILYQGQRIDYDSLLRRQQKGIEQHSIEVENDVLIVNVRELLEGIKPELATEREEVVNARKYLKDLRLRVHPQAYYPKALSLGELHYDWQEYTFARQALIEGHQAIRALRGFVKDRSTQVDLSEKSVSLYEMLVQCYLVEGDEAKAFEYAAIGKGRAFVNTLAKARFDLLTANNQAFTQKWRNARQLRSQIEELGEQAKNNNNKDDSSGQQHVLLREESELWREMEDDDPSLSATVSVPTLSTEQARDLAKGLQATLVEYYRHRGGWCAFVITADDIQVVDLPDLDEDLLSRLDNWRNNVHLGSGRSPRRLKRLEELHEAVVAPLRLNSKRVIMAPFRELHLLPLSATRHSETKRYLAQDYILSFTPSLTALHVVHQEQKRNRSLSKPLKRVLSVAYSGGGDQPLKVLEEAEAIADRLSDIATIERLHGKDATPDNVLAKAPYYDVIHFGCHGKFDASNPTASGLMLAEKPLTVQEIITKLSLKQTRLTTLAACLSGTVALRDGEEHIGLLQAMMMAGVKTVVASLWSVDDAATRTLFEAFYTQDAILNAPAEAMQDASELVRTTPTWKHPFYWSPFQVNGLSYSSVQSRKKEWPPTSLIENTIRYTQQSSQERSQSMDHKTVIEEVKLLLEDLFEYRHEALPALKQHRFSLYLGHYPIAAGELGIAQTIYLIVQDNPSLQEFLPEEEEMPRLRVSKEHHEASKSSSAASKNRQAANTVESVNQALISILNEEYLPAKNISQRGVWAFLIDFLQGRR